MDKVVLKLPQSIHDKIEKELVKELKDVGEKMEKKYHHPCFIIPEILNRYEISKTHRLRSAHAIRNILLLELKRFYNKVSLSNMNIIICEEPFAEVSKYEKVMVKCLNNPYPKKISDFQNECNEITADAPVNKEKSYLKRFCKIFVAREFSNSAKEMCFHYHIEYIDHREKGWHFSYTGIRKDDTK